MQGSRQENPHADGNLTGLSRGSPLRGVISFQELLLQYACYSDCITPRVTNLGSASSARCSSWRELDKCQTGLFPEIEFQTAILLPSLRSRKPQCTLPLLTLAVRISLRRRYLTLTRSTRTHRSGCAWRWLRYNQLVKIP